MVFALLPLLLLSLNSQTHVRVLRGAKHSIHLHTSVLVFVCVCVCVAVLEECMRSPHNGKFIK